MAKASKPKRETAPNEPDVNAGAELDLSSFRDTAPPSGAAKAERRAKDAKSSDEQEEREQRPRVKWEGLAGLAGLVVLDVWSDENETYGEYTGAVVRLPKPIPSGEHKGKTDVVVLTSAKTRAGKFLMRNLDAGRYDALDGEGDETLPITVRAKKSKARPDNPNPRPSIILRHPTGNEDGEDED